MDTAVRKELENDCIRRESAIRDLVSRAEKDRYIIACFIYGSVARGDCWFNSDIDTFLITTDESIRYEHRVLEESGYWFETFVFSRSYFIKLCNGTAESIGPASMRHGGRLVYCEDSSLKKFFHEDGILGSYEKMSKVFVSAAWTYFLFQKIEKYCGRGQGERAYNTLIALINQYAAILILSEGYAPEREVTEQALELVPELFAPYPSIIYGQMPDIEKIAQVTGDIKNYIYNHTGELFKPLIVFMREECYELSLSTIYNRFSGVMKIPQNEVVFGACEMLCDTGYLERGSIEVSVTKKSSVTFREPSYIYRNQR